LDPLKDLNSPKFGTKVHRELRRRSVIHQISGRKRSGPLKNLCPGGACRKSRPTAMVSHEEIPTAIGSGGVAHSLTLGRGIARENCGSRFLDRKIEEP
jgi:hypothetical protein